MREYKRVVEYLKFCKAKDQIVDVQGFKAFLQDVSFYMAIDKHDRECLTENDDFWSFFNWEEFQNIDLVLTLTPWEEKFLKTKEFENMKRLSLNGTLNPKIAQMFLSFDHNIDPELKAIARQQDDEVEYLFDVESEMSKLTASLRENKEIIKN